jgi:hypothetical protein
MEHGDIEPMQVESIAANVAAIGGHLRLVADFDQTSTTFVDYTNSLPEHPGSGLAHRHNSSFRAAIGSP